MSIFSETMTKAIGVYRTMLRRHLPQADRMNKLTELKLKDPKLYKSDVMLYNVGYQIIEDIQHTLDQIEPGYYSYSGANQFAQYLKDFLDSYELEGSELIHRTQRASRALVQAIQLLTLPRSQLTADVEKQLVKLNKIIASCGSDEQQELHKTTLRNAIHRQQEQKISFYQLMLNNFHDQQQQIDE